MNLKSQIKNYFDYAAIGEKRIWSSRINSRNLLRPGHAACAGCGLAIGMKLVLQAMGPKTIAVIVPSCEGAIGGVYPNTSYGVPTFHSAFEIAAPTATRDSQCP